MMTDRETIDALKLGLRMLAESEFDDMRGRMRKAMIYGLLTLDQQNQPTTPALTVNVEPAEREAEDTNSVKIEETTERESEISDAVPPPRKKNKKVGRKAPPSG